MSHLSDDTPFKSFVRRAFPSHSGVLPLEAAVRVLSDYACVSPCDAARIVDARLSHFSLSRMESYAAQLLSERDATPRRMTAMLPAVWDDDASPSPVKPRAEVTRKVCKQFSLSGKCSFGSRCLYHHTAQTAPALGIMDRCVSEMRGLHVNSSATPNMGNTKGVEKKDGAFGALPSATNNYCTPVKAQEEVIPSAVCGKGEGKVKATATAATPMIMVPLALFDNGLFGYSPFPHLDAPFYATSSDQQNAK